MKPLYVIIQGTMKLPWRLTNLFRYQLSNLNSWRKFSRPPEKFRQVIADEIQRQMRARGYFTRKLGLVDEKTKDLSELVDHLYKEMNIKKPETEGHKMSKSNQ